MIKSVTIKGIASFNTGITFDPTLINFIYGSNGSGKTTISNVLKNCSVYPDCNLDWKEDVMIDKLVYNRTFIHENFNSSEELKGIFTLGTDNTCEIGKIKKNKADIEKKNADTNTLNERLEEEKTKLNNIEETFTEKCWNILKKYENVFLKAFEGYRNSKQKFRVKVIDEYSTNKHKLEDYEKLKRNTDSIFNTCEESIPEIKALELFDFKSLEENPIFQTRIMGKNDLDIAKMILKLNNNDWVRQGREYFDSNENYCPFCQQSTTEIFRKQLNEYFDETYNNQMKTLELSIDKYKHNFQQLENNIESCINLQNKFVNNEQIASIKSIIVVTGQKNILNFDKKLKEPTVKIEIDSLNEETKKLAEIIDQANKKTQEHNDLVRNIDSERQNLIEKIWAFILNELKPDYSAYSTDKDSINRAIKEICDKIDETRNEIKKLEIQNQQSEKKITSVKPTIDSINKVLSNFGFTNFSLSEASKGKYKIVRDNGSNAQNTLSEGEKTFITFLYFYHLINGSFETKISTNKIVVIDDPVSSLDNSVLFIVSHLVMELINNCCSKQNNIKQIFILTHNVYFYKEITYHVQSYKKEEKSFWIVRKMGNESTIERYKVNPIQTSYDLLWQEIREKTKRNNLTVCNTLRRILEYYFKISGKNKEDILSKCTENEDKIIIHSLLFWINDGSHSIMDDVSVSIDDETVEKYLQVFKKIFEIEGQIAHYNMMMSPAKE